MARYVQNVLLNKPGDFVAFMMNDYLQKNGFSPSDWKGEPAFRAGDAMVEGYKYLKWGYDGSVLHVEAWLKGAFGKEMDLSGYIGCLQKKPFRESLEQLFNLMMQPVPMPGQPIYDMGGQPVPQPIPVRTVDNSSAASLALAFGIISLATAFIIPVCGILFGTLGVNRARLGGGSSKAKQAAAGRGLSIAGVIVAIVIWILNIVLNISIIL